MEIWLHVRITHRAVRYCIQPVEIAAIALLRRRAGLLGSGWCLPLNASVSWPGAGAGDAPGLNAVLRALVKSARTYGCECVGLEDSFDGLIYPDRVRVLTP